MVLGVVELRKVIQRVRTRASRAQGFLRQISKISTKRPSFETIVRAGSLLQQALAAEKDIANDIDNILA